jgi:hypothetical protein
VAALIKAMVYATGLGMVIPVFVEVTATWGRDPTWLQDPALSTYFSVAAALTVMVYVFELTYRSGLGYDVWLHHTASVVAIAIAVTGVFLAESELPCCPHGRYAWGSVLPHGGCHTCTAGHSC